MFWAWLGFVLGTLFSGCAVAIGDNSRASVNTDADVKREVDIDGSVAPDAANSKRILKKENPK